MGEWIQKIGFRGWVTISIVAIVVILFAAYAANERKVIVDGEVRAARNLVMMAESVRDNMAQKWDLGLFTTSELRRINETETDPQVRKAKLLAAIPVVAAWESAKAKSEEGGFEFRTPREDARNPANEPDRIEAEALRLFESSRDLQEHWVIDEEKNAIRY
ncbi:MAG: DUF3365 domain-containing protein, partial [Gammaproteobacteria bacterium]